MKVIVQSLVEGFATFSHNIPRSLRIVCELVKHS